MKGQSRTAQYSVVGVLSVGQVGAVRLFFTPEEGNDPQSYAKRHFLHTGESKDKTECFGSVFLENGQR